MARIVKDPEMRRSEILDVAQNAIERTLNAPAGSIKLLDLDQVKLWL